MSKNICVMGGGYFLPPGHKNEEMIKESLKLPNPEYKMAMSMRQKGRYVPVPNEHINGCQSIPFEHPWGGGVAIPRKAGVGIDLGQMLDHTTCPDAEKITTAKGFELREYQQEALDSWFNANGEGVIVAPCGSGKTAMGLTATTIINTKALVLVHTNDLAVQWKNRCTAMLGVEATQYGAGKKDDSGRIVIATFQTLERMSFTARYDFGKQFGLCIVDEAHHVPAHTFCKVMFCMPAKYRLGLTATPTRPDGLTKILWWHFGPCVYEITNAQLTLSGHIVPPKIEWLMTDWTGPNGRVDWSKLISKMTKDQSRNDAIVSRVRMACANGRQVLVLSDRVDHCIELAEQISQCGIVANPLVGKMTKKQRIEVLESAEKKITQVICATTVADEGLDLPTLDTVVLTTPTKALGRIQQRIGRVMRPHPLKKNPLVIDCVDDIGSMHGLARKRHRLYTKIGCS